MIHSHGPPPFIRPGALVWYEAAPGRTFAAIVDTEPVNLGGTWCVNLRDLDDGFAEWAPGRTRVECASVRSLTAREEETEE